MASKTVDYGQAKQISIIIGVVAVLLNVAFYFLSQMYYADRAATYGMVSPETLSAARISFAIMSGSVSAIAVVALFFPRHVSHGLVAVIGLTALVGAAKATHYHPVLPATLVVLGALILVLLYFSFASRSRAAWSFLVATCGVGSLVTLFGATKVRNAVDIGLFYALILPGILAVATVMLINLSDDYAEA